MVHEYGSGARVIDTSGAISQLPFKASMTRGYASDMRNQGQWYMNEANRIENGTSATWSSTRGTFGSAVAASSEVTGSRSERGSRSSDTHNVGGNVMVEGSAGKSTREVTNDDLILRQGNSRSIRTSKIAPLDTLSVSVRASEAQLQEQAAEMNPPQTQAPKEMAAAVRKVLDYRARSASMDTDERNGAKIHELAANVRQQTRLRAAPISPKMSAAGLWSVATAATSSLRARSARTPTTPMPARAEPTAKAPTGEYPRPRNAVPPPRAIARSAAG
jgi:hypothetical protein